MAVSKTLKLDKSGGGVNITEGSHIGLLSGIIHLGSQKNVYKGVTTIVDKVLLQFELQDVLMDSGKPVTISKIERNSMREKANLPKIGKALGADINEGIDFEALIGKPVMVNMEKNQDGTKVVPRSFARLPSILAKEVKPLQGTPKLYLDVEEITEAQKAEMPEWVRKIIDERVAPTGGATDSTSDTVEL